jgi:hypothetical protein
MNNLTSFNFDLFYTRDKMVISLHLEYGHRLYNLNIENPKKTDIKSRAKTFVLIKTCYIMYPLHRPTYVELNKTDFSILVFFHKLLYIFKAQLIFCIMKEKEKHIWSSNVVAPRLCLFLFAKSLVLSRRIFIPIWSIKYRLITKLII